MMVSMTSSESSITSTVQLLSSPQAWLPWILWSLPPRESCRPTVPPTFPACLNCSVVYCRLLCIDHQVILGTRHDDPSARGSEWALQTSAVMATASKRAFTVTIIWGLSVAAFHCGCSMKEPSHERRACRQGVATKSSQAARHSTPVVIIIGSSSLWCCTFSLTLPRMACFHSKNMAFFIIAVAQNAWGVTVQSDSGWGLIMEFLMDPHYMREGECCNSKKKQIQALQCGSHRHKVSSWIMNFLILRVFPMGQRLSSSMCSINNAHPWWTDCVCSSWPRHSQNPWKCAQ